MLCPYSWSVSQGKQSVVLPSLGQVHIPGLPGGQICKKDSLQVRAGSCLPGVVQVGFCVRLILSFSPMFLLSSFRSQRQIPLFLDPDEVHSCMNLPLR